MKIGVFHPSFAEFGGGEFVALVIANTLARTGHQVELFVSSNADQDSVRRMFGEELDSSINIRVKSASSCHRDIFDIFQITFRSLVFKRKCDILIDTYSNYVFPWSDICYVHFPFLNDRDYKRNFPYLRGRCMRNIFGLPHFIYARKLQKYEDKLVIANSKYTANILKSFAKANVEVIYPPVLSNPFHELDSRVNNCSKEDLVVTISRFDSQKGLQAIPYIARRTRKPIKFVLLGILHDKKVYSSIKQDIARLNLNDRIEVIADASKKELESVLRRAKVYLHTKTGEHFGISIVEAMAMGCTPIVHNSGGMVEYVPSEYLYGNPQEAAQKIDGAISEWTPERATEMIKISKRFSEATFSKHFAASFSAYIEHRSAKKHH